MAGGMAGGMASKIKAFLREEIQFDTNYHVVLTVAVVLKVVFVICAVISLYEVRQGREHTSFAIRVVKLKDMCNELVKIIVCLLVVYLFSPFKPSYCMDKSMKILLFTFAIITLIEVHWVVFIKHHYIIRTLQYFTGRLGTFNEQRRVDIILRSAWERLMNRGRLV